MTCVRFYVGFHGLRLCKTRARLLLDSVVDLEHAHVDVLQVHRANTLRCPDGDVLLIKLDGSDSLAGLYREAVNIAGKTNKYTTGFLVNYGYFRRHALPASANDVVTYAQAYNSGAKMTKSTDSGFVAAFVACRGYVADHLVDGDGGDSNYLKNLAQATTIYSRSNRVRADVRP